MLYIRQLTLFMLVVIITSTISSEILKPQNPNLKTGEDGKLEDFYHKQNMDEKMRYMKLLFGGYSGESKSFEDYENKPLDHRQLKLVKGFSGSWFYFVY